MAATPRTVYQVSELSEILRGLLEDSLPRLWVQGEISNFSRPSSGHWYFTLKDAQSQMRCAMFKGANFHVRPLPKEGDQVLVRGQVTLYPARGDLQLVCEHMEPAGEGALLRAFEQLKARLAAEGLFDEKYKRPMPSMPRAIGVITSATGAALHDILTTLSRRFPLMQVNLWPVPVQGKEAAPAIVEALQGLPQRAAVDVIVLARGGGSLEDLWAFNEEAVARAVRACAVPVVTGIGHEIDFTIADFAADRRAATPTAAAELVSPDGQEWQRRIGELQRALQQLMGGQQQHATERLARATARVVQLHPGRRLNEAAQRLDAWHGRLTHAQRTRLEQMQVQWRAMTARVGQLSPMPRLELHAGQVQSLQARLHTQTVFGLQRHRATAERLHAVLQGLSPLAVLDRGYALVRRPDGRVLRDASAAAIGESLEIVLARGQLDVEVQRTQS